jgi:serine protease Do
MTQIRAMQWGALAAVLSFSLTALVIWTVSPAAAGKPPAASAAASAAPDPAQWPTASTPLLPSPAAPQSDSNLRLTNDVRVYQMVKDAVVNITSSRIVTARVATGNDFFDTFNPQFRQVPAQSLGSGFVIHPSGYIITNEHVVEQGTDVQCVFANGDKLTAQVIATDNDHDLAVLKVNPKKPLPAVPLGASEDLMIGEPVYAIGNPYGFTGTMTRGIISARDRTLEVSASKSYTGLIQTDASINPGNSGGPLLNAYGQVIGVNTAIRQGAQGIGFAISVSNMRDLLPAFLNPEALNRAQVGFTVEEKRTSKPPATVMASVVVKNVEKDTRAASAGLKVGDQLVAINSTPVNNVVDALVAMTDAKPGDDLSLQVLRGASANRLKVTIPVIKAPPPPVEDLLLTKMGVKAQTVTPAITSRSRLAVGQGVYVESIQQDSPAAQCGIAPGDVLIQLGRYRVNSTEDVATLLKTVAQPTDALVVIVRGNTIGRGVISLK